MFKLITFLDIDYNLQLETREWRNSEDVSKYFQIPYIDIETHKKWLYSLTIENPKTIAFMIKKDDDSKFIGVTYLQKIDYIKKECDFGIYIYDTSMRGKGVGEQVINLILKFARENLKFEIVYLEVLESNLTAKRLYEKCGFKFLSKQKNVLRCCKIL